MRGFFLLSRYVLLCAPIAFPPASAFPQAKDQKNGEKPAGIEGAWIEVSKEGGGFVLPMLPSLLPHPNAPTEGHWIWRFSNAGMEISIKIKGKEAAREKALLEIDPAGKRGTFNSIALDKDGKPLKGVKWAAIYFVKDDYLMICTSVGENPQRPERFSTTGQAANVWMYVFRRMEQK